MSMNSHEIGLENMNHQLNQTTASHIPDSDNNFSSNVINILEIEKMEARYR